MKKSSKKKIHKRITNKSKDRIVPLADRVIVKEEAESGERKTESGIIIPVTVSEDKGGKMGIVIATGRGRIEDGKLIPISIKVGDKILFQWGDKVKIDGEDLYIVKESEVLAILN